MSSHPSLFPRIKTSPWQPRAYSNERSSTSRPVLTCQLRALRLLREVAEMEWNRARAGLPSSSVVEPRWSILFPLMILSSVGILPRARYHFDGPRPTLRASKLKYLGDLTKKFRSTCPAATKCRGGISWPPTRKSRRHPGRTASISRGC